MVGSFSLRRGWSRWSEIRAEELHDVRDGRRILGQEPVAALVDVGLRAGDARSDGLAVAHRGDAVEAAAPDEGGTVDRSQSVPHIVAPPRLQLLAPPPL